MAIEVNGDDDGVWATRALPLPLAPAPPLALPLHVPYPYPYPYRTPTHNHNPNPNQVHTALAGLGDMTAVHEQVRVGVRVYP